MPQPTLELESCAALPSLPVRFPERAEGMDQDEEWFEFAYRGQTRRLGMHDYGEIFRVPGLYESLVYEALECRSPREVVGLFLEALRETGARSEDLRLIDIGAGNGVVGEHLRAQGVEHVLGLDLAPEAAEAAERDRPGVYEDYVVCDLTTPLPRDLERLREFAPDGLVTIAALGFGDIPPAAFSRALTLIPRDGWVAMCIKEEFLDENDAGGFGVLIRRLIREGTLEVIRKQRYVHRLSIAGEPLYYVALVARKRRTAGRVG